MQEFKSRNHFVSYKKHIGNEPNVDGYDVIFVCNSIVCFETEIDAIKNILKEKKFLSFYVALLPSSHKKKFQKS